MVLSENRLPVNLTVRISHSHFYLLGNAPFDIHFCVGTVQPAAAGVAGVVNLLEQVSLHKPSGSDRRDLVAMGMIPKLHGW